MASERRFAQVDYKVTTSPGYLDLPPLHKGFLSFLMEHYHNYPPGLLDASLTTLADEFGVEKSEAEKILADLSGTGDLQCEDIYLEHDPRARLTLVWPSLREPQNMNDAVSFLGLALKARPDSPVATAYLQSVVAITRQQDWFLKREELEEFERRGLPLEEVDREKKRESTTWKRLKALIAEVAALTHTESDTISTGIKPGLKQQEQEQDQKENLDQEEEGEGEGARGGGRGGDASTTPAEEEAIPFEGKKVKRRVGQPSPPSTLLAEVFEHLQDNLPKEIQRDAAPLASSGSKLQKLWLEGESIDRIKASIDAFEVADWQPAIAKKWLQAMKALAGNKNLLAIARQAKISDFSLRSITLDFAGTTSADYVRDEENFGRPIREAFKNAWGRVEIVLEGEEQTAGA
jgi:hypothetical protein